MDVREKARLTWHCRRGMLELDLILQRFMDAKIDELNEQELNAFDLLLNYTDPELFSWLMGHTDPEDKVLYDIVSLIRTNY
ncbi:MAG: succinate dehydrogenase assembly factor 2 [Legionella sp.]|nr:succinate dehydrogenase assembly factor 2 [Legionella sp.]